MSCSLERACTPATPPQRVRIRAPARKRAQTARPQPRKTSATRARPARRPRPAPTARSRRRSLRAHRPSRRPTRPRSPSRVRPTLRPGARPARKITPRPRARPPTPTTRRNRALRLSRPSAPQSADGQSQSTSQSAPTEQAANANANSTQVAPYERQRGHPARLPRKRRPGGSDEQLTGKRRCRKHEQPLPGIRSIPERRGIGCRPVSVFESERADDAELPVDRHLDAGQPAEREHRDPEQEPGRRRAGHPDELRAVDGGSRELERGRPGREPASEAAAARGAASRRVLRRAHRPFRRPARRRPRYRAAPTNASVTIDPAAPDPNGSGAIGTLIQVWIPNDPETSPASSPAAGEVVGADSSTATASAGNTNHVTQSAVQEQDAGGRPSSGPTQVGGGTQTQVLEQSAPTTQTADRASHLHSGGHRRHLDLVGGRAGVERERGHAVGYSDPARRSRRKSGSGDPPGSADHAVGGRGVDRRFRRESLVLELDQQRLECNLAERSACRGRRRQSRADRQAGRRQPLVRQERRDLARPVSWTARATWLSAASGSPAQSGSIRSESGRHDVRDTGRRAPQNRAIPPQESSLLGAAGNGAPGVSLWAFAALLVPFFLRPLGGLVAIARRPSGGC